LFIAEKVNYRALTDWVSGKKMNKKRF